MNMGMIRVDNALLQGENLAVLDVIRLSFAPAEANARIGQPAAAALHRLTADAFQRTLDGDTAGVPFTVLIDADSMTYDQLAALGRDADWLRTAICGHPRVDAWLDSLSWAVEMELERRGWLDRYASFRRTLAALEGGRFVGCLLAEGDPD